MHFYCWSVHFHLICSKVWCMVAPIFVDRTLNKGFNISVMITNSPVRLYVDSSRDSFPFYPHQFKSQRLACEDSTGQIKVQDSALFWSGLWSLKHITWQASSITVSYLAVLSTGGVKTWWNRPQIQVLETSGRSFSDKKTQLFIGRCRLIERTEKYQMVEHGSPAGMRGGHRFMRWLSWSLNEEPDDFSDRPRRSNLHHVQ